MAQKKENLEQENKEMKEEKVEKKTGFFKEKILPVAKTAGITAAKTVLITGGSYLTVKVLSTAFPISSVFEINEVFTPEPPKIEAIDVDVTE